jgi:cyclopropane fatty-acyl-phospholipid synthase-like methyltransferase
MEEMWNKRYSQEDFVYGKKPNRFFEEVLNNQITKPGRMLLPAEGEGRNAVFAARMGWDVEAFDISQEGQKKALRLAEEANVSISYQVGPLEDQHYEEVSFDAVVLIFAHFPPSIRKDYFKAFVKLLKPGGYVIMEVFSKAQLKYSKINPKAGGPKSIELLYDQEEIRSDFPELEVELLEEKIVSLEEGEYHKGESSVIRFIGRKSK